MSRQCVSGMFAMCFTPKLILTAIIFVSWTFVNSWTQNRLGSAKGGPYLGVHLRRKDFIWGHRDDVPSLKGAVKKIRSLMKKHKLQQVFVATDADEEGTDQKKESKTSIMYERFKQGFIHSDMFSFLQNFHWIEVDAILPTSQPHTRYCDVLRNIHWKIQIFVIVYSTSCHS